MSKKLLSLFVWLTVAVVGFATFLLFFNHAFPVASIDLRLNKDAVFKRATAFIESQKFTIKGYERAIVFDSDNDAAVYLQRFFGIKKSNELIRKEIPVWFWQARWFKELQKEGFSVFIDPSSGGVLHFHYEMLDDEKGANLVEAEAQQMAENIITSQGISLGEYELKENTKKQQKQRTDYYFSWEKKGYKLQEATLRLDVSIYGDKLGRYCRYLKVPEGFIRDLVKEQSSGYVLSIISSVLTFLLFISAIVVLMVQYKKSQINWKFAFICGCSIAILIVIVFLNSMPLLWIAYPDTVSKVVFFATAMGGACIAALLAGASILLYGSSGESLSRELGQKTMPLLYALNNKKKINVEALISTGIVGYSLSFAFLGYVTLFYLIGAKFLNIWVPLTSDYSNILGTCMPFLFPLTVALSAAFAEEFTYRLFGISLLKKYARLTWLALVVPAFMWAMGHSGYAVYPTYIRVIELIIPGVIFGLVFLRYGLETILVAHFVIDAILVGLPLMKSHNIYFIVSGVIIILLALFPLGVLFFLSKRRGEE